MRINHNISALKANNQLFRTNKQLDKSLERLSSGYRINSAADDSAGLAISEKMRTQIAGLDQASRNAADGISVIQTAEGALTEVETMLQRMRELAVQSANGIYTTEDRRAIQAEVDQLKEEISRISNNTEFNTMTLLDGNIDRRSYSSDNQVNLISLSDTVGVGDYELKITQDARQAVIVGKATDGFVDITDKITKEQAGSININGESIEIKEGDTIEQVYEKIRNACDAVNLDVFASDGVVGANPKDNIDTAGYESKPLEPGDSLVFVSRDYGSDQKIDIYSDNPELCKLFGLTIDGAHTQGVDAKAELTFNGTPIDPADPDKTSDSLFANTATVSIKGNKVTVSDSNNFKMVFEVDAGTVGTKFVDYIIDEDPADNGPIDQDENDPNISGASKDITVSVLNAGPMDLQIGANEGQTMSVRIPKVTPETLGIDKINMATADGSQEAIELLDIAINEISAIRSKLGAYQNRLEHSISNLDVTGENMTEALSRIKDTDMASEMAEYTQKNVLSQAGISMLAQANQRPQSILSLLQG